ncbi:MAG: C40 family peptidase [Muribaculaceae bacterium]|nr:C40 family peptidase [Muribaculaceae bacterium]MDE6329719.1 C40 family peptidase [Muribaculaceae bacterium]
MAGNKARIDKTVISDMVSKDVLVREQAPSLSAESSKLIDDLLAEGRSHIGKRYVHGAKGPHAFDCSGFTSYVYKQFGYNISPASRMQYNEGKEVDRKDLRKGDLVFFTSPKSGKQVGHVGIVVSADNETGNFKFIHASIRGVKISDFEGYYVPRYIGAKRIIED